MATFMGLNAQEWTTIFAALAIIVAILSGVGKMINSIKKNDPKLVKDLPHEFESLGKDFVDLWKYLGKDSYFAALAAKEKLEAHHIADRMTELQLEQSALKGLSVFNKALGVKLNQMAATQKMDLSDFVKADMASKTKAQITDEQVIATLKKMQESQDVVEAKVIPDVQAHEAALKAWGSLDAPKPEVSKTTSDTPVDNGQAPVPEVS